MDNPQEMNTRPDKVAKNVVVSLEYTLNVDGELVDYSEKDAPLEYLQGHGQIISGLETALEGMQVGDTRQVTVSAREGYGEVDPSAVVEVSRADFPPDIPVEVGLPLQVRNIDGDILDARILDITGDRVRLDFNHPLAGKDLTFNVTIAGLRPATEEELAHGHVHGEFLDEDEFEEDEFEMDIEELDEEFDEDDLEDDEDIDEEEEDQGSIR